MLGSGGARGHAHIGVIRAIEELGLEVRNISGTSMGAVIGGIYAAGKLDEYVEWAYQLTRSDIVSLLDLAFSRKSIFKGERIIEALEELLGDCRIEDMDINFTAVATSLDDQAEVWLNAGSLFTAIRASTAVPGIFAPVERDGRILVDGGLVNPVPIAPTLSDATDLTIAVNLAGLQDDYVPPEPAKRKTAQDESYRKRIADFLSGLQWGSESDSDGDDMDVADLVIKSIDVMQGAIARLKLAAYAPDKTVEIPRNACSFFEFERAEEMAGLGYDRARESLSGLVD